MGVEWGGRGPDKPVKTSHDKLDRLDRAISSIAMPEALDSLATDQSSELNSPLLSTSEMLDAIKPIPSKPKSSRLLLDE